MEAFWKVILKVMPLPSLYIIYDLLPWLNCENFVFCTGQLLSLPSTVTLLWVPPSALSLQGWTGSGEEHHQSRKYFSFSFESWCFFSVLQGGSAFVIQMWWCEISFILLLLIDLSNVQSAQTGLFIDPQLEWIFHSQSSIISRSQLVNQNQ